MTLPDIRSSRRRSRGRSSSPARSTVQARVPSHRMSKATTVAPIASAAGSGVGVQDMNLREEGDEEDRELWVRRTGDQPVRTPNAGGAPPPRRRPARAVLAQQRTQTQVDQERGTTDAQHVVGDLRGEDQRRDAQSRQRGPGHHRDAVAGHAPERGDPAVPRGGPQHQRRGGARRQRQHHRDEQELPDSRSPGRPSGSRRRHRCRPSRAATRRRSAAPRRRDSPPGCGS